MSEDDNISFYLRKAATAIVIIGCAVNVAFGLWFTVLYGMGHDRQVPVLSEADFPKGFGIGVGVWLLLAGVIGLVCALKERMRHWIRSIILIIVALPPLFVCMVPVPVAVVGPVFKLVGAILFLVLSFRTRTIPGDTSKIPLASVGATTSYATDNQVFQK